jgi:hypothetical protein
LRLYRDGKRFVTTNQPLCIFDCAGGMVRDPMLYIRERWRLSEGAASLPRRLMQFGGEWFAHSCRQRCSGHFAKFAVRPVFPTRSSPSPHGDARQRAISRRSAPLNRKRSIGRYALLRARVGRWLALLWGAPRRQLAAGIAEMHSLRRSVCDNRPCSSDADCRHGCLRRAG